MAHKLLVSLALISPLIIGCSQNTDKSKTKALFNTRSEAEAAAKSFNCTGAHKMGEMWMPCEKHNTNGHSVHSHHNH